MSKEELEEKLKFSKWGMVPSLLKLEWVEDTILQVTTIHGLIFRIKWNIDFVVLAFTNNITIRADDVWVSEWSAPVLLSICTSYVGKNSGVDIPILFTHNNIEDLSQV